MCVAAWVAYVWDDGDGERAAFLTAIAVIAGRRLAGGRLGLGGAAVGPPAVAVRLGPVPPVPVGVVGLWNLGNDRRYRDLVADNDRHRAERRGR